MSAPGGCPLGLAAALALLGARPPAQEPLTEAALFAGAARDGAGGKYGARRTGRSNLERRSPLQAHAIGAALDWLARHQDADGRFDADGFAKHDAPGKRCDGAGHPVHDVAVTAFALLAFLHDGSHPNGGPHRDQVRRGLVWLLRQQDESGRIGLPTTEWYVLHHAVATLVVLEAQILSGCDALAPYGRRAVAFLESERQPGGAWRLRTGTDDLDHVLTVWATLAYRAAAETGLVELQQPLDEIEAWLLATPLPNSAAAPGAALLAHLFAAHDGVLHPLMQRRAAQCVERCRAQAEAAELDAMARLLAERAVFQLPNTKSAERALRALPLPPPRDDGCAAGSWDPAGSWAREGGRVYTTALLALMLQTDYAHTPLFR